MSVGLRARRAVTRWLTDIGPDARVTRVVVTRTCRQRGVDCVFEQDWIALTRADTEIRLRTDQSLFAPYVADHFDVFAASVGGSPTAAGRIVDFSKPAIHRYITLDADFELPAFPEAIDFGAEYFRYGRPAPGSVVFDLGANVGLVTYALSRAVETEGRVLSFEPDPTSLEYLARNVQRHDLANVEIVEAAIANVCGTLSFFAEGTITSGLASTRKEAVMTKSLGSVVDCEAITLSDAFERHGTPSWIKMDIEGAEIDVLEHSREILKAAKPFLVIDTSHIVGSDTTAERVERILQSIGYDTRTDTPGGSQLTWAAYGKLPQ